MWCTLSNERSGLWFSVVAGHRLHSLSRVESRGTRLVWKEREKKVKGGNERHYIGVGPRGQYL
jgi:hypothetical protein